MLETYMRDLIQLSGNGGLNLDLEIEIILRVFE